MAETKRSADVEAWFEEFHGRLLGYLTHRLNMEAEAEDLAQEVFLRLLRLEDPAAVNHPRAFLFRIAANVVDDWRDRHYRVSVQPPDNFDALESGSNPGQEAIAQQRSAALEQALERLPRAHRGAVVLKAKHGLTHKEIAVRLGVSERRVKRYLIKGYARLREELAELRTERLTRR